MDDSQDYQEYERQQQQERQSHLQSVINFAARLAHHRLLENVKSMIMDVDLTSVPAEHLASLASSVTGELHIKNVSGCDLVTILDNVKCNHLYIWSQSLGSEETQALVRAIESRVGLVILHKGVTLDIGSFASFNPNSLFDRYRGKLRTLARCRNWKVIKERKSCYTIQRQ